MIKKKKKKSLVKRMTGRSRSLIFLLFLVVIVILSIICTGLCQSCQDTAWEKVNGARPEYTISKVALFSGENAHGIVIPCFERCKRINCTAFVIDIDRSLCYSVEVQGDEFVPESNAIFYQEICIKVPKICKEKKLWQVERTLGAVLLDVASVWLPQLMRRSRCYKMCIDAGGACKSAQFRASKALSINNILGRCALSMAERSIRPQTYRASMYRDEYLQHQCHDILKMDYCSYAEFPNVTLPYSDLELPGVDKQECESRCDLGEDGFICRSYTVVYTSNQKPICRLHSEDTLSLGTSSLENTPNSIYKEREPCLDVKVKCSDTMLTVTLTTLEPFDGRLYANGYGNDCGIQGTGRNVTILTLPLPKTEELEMSKIPCGFTPAFSIDNENRTRTMIWATIVVQFNPIIQRLGDQAVKVGCTIGEHDIPKPRNISVQSSLSFADPNAGVPPISTIVMNASSEVPVITMRILNEDHQDAVVTKLGERLTLRIEINPADGPYDIMAGHLVASSATGHWSYLLLNEVGCPTDPTTFPALSKDPIDNRSLIATFTAFKFPESQLVRFNVIVKFCLDICEPAHCEGNRVSYGRRKRKSTIATSTSEPYITAEVTEIFRNKTPDELPLQLSIIVQSPVIFADPLLSRENTTPDTILIAGGHSIDGLLCVDASLVLGLLIFWLIIQIILIASCLFAVGRYRKMAIRAEEDRADILARHLYGIHGGNFEISRRVRWADRNNSSIS
ncbi:uncharacterized protein LOC122525883 [Polistes fuscatus]|uniref:uncharacterized protein LOC122525883 n=1 Tax=Polistes fuscatus TaxID=30207 RepID=UPI001CA7FB6B|nr:uncharacterized protein LOC122525883 [Polistes fuscatus]